MRHRIKKIPTLSKISHIHNHHLLHSDKSVALRFGPLSGRKLSNLHNFLRKFLLTASLKKESKFSFSSLSSSVQRPVLFSPEKRGFLEKMMSYVKQAVQTFTYFYSSKKDNKLNFLYSSKISTIPLVLSAFGLLLVLGCMISPNASILGVDKASAISEEECRGNTRVAMSLSGVTGDTVSLVNNNVNSDITNNTLSKLSQDFNVIACNVKNYKLYVQAESSLLKNQSVPDALLPVGNNVDESAFPDNTWGYNISPTEAPTNTYNTMPNLSSTIPEAYVASKGTSYQGQNFTISFAAKFTNTKAAGHYTSDVLLSLVADPNITLSGIDTMQEMTPVICANSTEHETKQLIDVRDHKPYWVAKLKDGNCWMTQNLDLDLSADVVLTPGLSDVATDWTPPVTTWRAPFTVWPTETDMDYSYDVGEYIYTKPGENNNCGSGVEIDSLEKCTGDKGWKEVSQLQPSSGGEFTGILSEDGAQYNAHLLAGNYYSYNIATAGTGTDLLTGDASSSICPKGWRMMTARGVGSIYDLLPYYGFSWSPVEVDGQSILTANVLATAEDGKEYNVSLSPIYLLPSGGIDNGIAYAGSLGVYWLSTAANRVSVWLENNRVSAGELFMRASADSVRCVAR